MKERETLVWERREVQGEKVREQASEAESEKERDSNCERKRKREEEGGRRREGGRKRERVREILRGRKEIWEMRNELGIRKKCFTNNEKVRV